MDTNKAMMAMSSSNNHGSNDGQNMSARQSWSGCGSNTNHGTNDGQAPHGHQQSNEDTNSNYNNCLNRQKELGEDEGENAPDDLLITPFLNSNHCNDE